jgi:hypothetical protein
MPSPEGSSHINEEAAKFKAPKRNQSETSIAANDNQPTNGKHALSSLTEQSITVGTNKHTPEGWQIIVNKHPVKEDPLPTFSKTGDREGGHAVLGALDGRIVHKVSTRPGPGYLGITQLDGYSEVAAAYHADEPGGSQDAKIIEMKGGNVSAAVAKAKEMKAKYRRHIAHVAHAADKDDLGHEQVVSIMKDVDKKLAEKEELKKTAIIDIFAPDGSKTQLKAPIENNKVELPKSATVYSLAEHRKANALPSQEVSEQEDSGMSEAA